MTKKENFIRTVKRNNPKWVPYGSEGVITIPCPVIERPQKAGNDAFSVYWDYNPAAEGGTYPLDKNFIITDISRWKEQIVFPDINKIDWESTLKTVNSIDRNEFLIEGFCEMGIFERTYLLMGMEEALIAYYTHPKEMYELCGAIADYKIELIKKYYETAKFDLLWYGDDWGTQENLFISPEKWRKIIKPHTQRIYNCIKETGAMINQHSCGKIENVIGDICDMGADIWNPCQPCDDLKRLKERFGSRICFYGGVDSQFILDNDEKTPQDVKDEVIKRIDELTSPDGGYILAPSHGVPYEKDKLLAMKETAFEYGRKIFQV